DILQRVTVNIGVSRIAGGASSALTPGAPFRGSHHGVTVSVTVFEPLAPLAVIVTEVFLATFAVRTVNGIDVDDLGTVTVDGTIAHVQLPFRLITTPPGVTMPS